MKYKKIKFGFKNYKNKKYTIYIDEYQLEYLNMVVFDGKYSNNKDIIKAIYKNKDLMYIFEGMVPVVETTIAHPGYGHNLPTHEYNMGFTYEEKSEKEVDIVMLHIEDN